MAATNKSQAQTKQMLIQATLWIEIKYRTLITQVCYRSNSRKWQNYSPIACTNQLYKFLTSLMMTIPCLQAVHLKTRLLLPITIDHNLQADSNNTLKILITYLKKDTVKKVLNSKISICHINMDKMRQIMLRQREHFRTMSNSWRTHTEAPWTLCRVATEWNPNVLQEAIILVRRWQLQSEIKTIKCIHRGKLITIWRSRMKPSRQHTRPRGVVTTRKQMSGIKAIERQLLVRLAKWTAAFWELWNQGT